MKTRIKMRSRTRKYLIVMSNSTMMVLKTKKNRNNIVRIKKLIEPKSMMKRKNSHSQWPNKFKIRILANKESINKGKDDLILMIQIGIMSLFGEVETNGTLSILDLITNTIPTLNGSQAPLKTIQMITCILITWLKKAIIKAKRSIITTITEILRNEWI